MAEDDGKPGPKPGQKHDWALPAGTIVERRKCPSCGRLANVKVTRNGRLMLICPHAIEETLEPCNTKVQYGLVESRRLSEAYRRAKGQGPSAEPGAKKGKGRDGGDWW